MSEEKVRKIKASGLPRMKMPEQDPVRRASNFEEVPYGISLEMAMDEASRCLQCPKPRCKAACPVNINIPQFVAEISKGDPKAAAEKLKTQTALPAVCGRVCPQESQCEGSCVLGIRGEPVAIGALERFAADYVRLNNLEKAPEKAAPTGKRVAIIGCGPAGITAAADLAIAGHEVEIFEALHLPGGVLMYGIPQFRLPKEIVSHEVESLKKLGVKIHLNYIVGKLRTLESLLEDGFDAVFLGSGAGLPMFLGIPGENSVGVFSANEFLTRFNLMKAYDFPEHGTTARWAGPSRSRSTSSPSAAAMSRWIRREPPCASAPSRQSSTAARSSRCPPARRRYTTRSRRAWNFRCSPTPSA